MSTELERHKKALDVAVNHLAAQVTLGHLTGSAVAAAKEAGDKINAILNPPPEMEEVEVVRWECKTCGEMFKSQEVSSGNACCWGTDTLVKLTGTLQRPKPQPVERTVSGEVEWGSGYGCVHPVGADAIFHWPDLVGKCGILTFTYTEDPK